MNDTIILLFSFLTLCLGAVGALAAVSVVPEVRKKLGLEKKPDANGIVRVESFYGALNNSGVILDFKPDSPYGYYDSNNLIAYSYPYLTLQVTSLAEKENVRIEPYLEIYISKVKKLDNPDYYRHFPDGIGGGGNPQIFVALLVPHTSRKVYAPLIEEYLDDGGYSFHADNNYIFLTPGEFESFQIIIHMLPGYYYEFSVGIPVHYAAKQVVVKTDRIFRCAAPIIKKEWTVEDIDEYGIRPRSGATFVELDNQREHDDEIETMTASKIQELQKEINKLPAIQRAMRQ